MLNTHQTTGNDDFFLGGGEVLSVREEVTYLFLQVLRWTYIKYVVPQCSVWWNQTHPHPPAPSPRQFASFAEI